VTGAWRIAGIYTVVGLGWIFLSSIAVWMNSPEPVGFASLLEVAKGCAFILVTALLLLVLLRRWEGELNRRGAALADTNRELTALNTRLSGIMRGSHDLIAAWDRDKRLTAFNPRYQAVCWNFFQRDVKIGMSIQEIFGHVPDRIRLFSECWDRTLNGESFVQLQSLTIDGDIAWFETSYGSLPGPDGRPSGGFHIVRDVTDRVRAEDNGRIHAENLAKAVELLSAANAELERFAYVASHDLQEPLRTITCFTQLIERDYRNAFDERGREYLELVAGGAQRMHQMINDLLSYTKMTRSEGRIEPVSAERACKDAVSNLREAIDSSGARVIIGPLPSVAADSVLLIQLFQNLIGNAIKYRKDDIAPLVEIRAESQDGTWRFAVADNGIGFDPAEQDVFELFRRLHPHAGYSGTGVGLAVCRWVVNRLGGRIWVDSIPGKGSTFYFTLPVAEDLPALGAPV
jgi:PAS domain S-box-containing protein